ncbi:MAG: hypothetical protein HYS13_03785 [Planctomycetia bacterium]|nr:hypothetical protein [Planctomycetia bacterium]
MVTNSKILDEVHILSDVIAPDNGDLPPAVARTVLKWRFSDRAVAEMNRLAKRNNDGTITPGELDALHEYVRVGTFINLVQAKARLSLKSTKSAKSK